MRRNLDWFTTQHDFRTPTSDSIPEIGKETHQTSSKTASRSSLAQPRRNLYVNNTAFSMDCPTISVENVDRDSDQQPPISIYSKRHSTGDALEIFSSLQNKPRFIDAGSSGSLGSTKGASGAAVTDFWILTLNKSHIIYGTKYFDTFRYW